MKLPHRQPTLFPAIYQSSLYMEVQNDLLMITRVFLISFIKSVFRYKQKYLQEFFLYFYGTCIFGLYYKFYNGLGESGVTH